MIFNPLDEWIGRSLSFYGEYSESEVSIFSEEILPGDTILDVGANIGALTLPFARITGNGGKVFAFEPQQQIYYMLCGNIALNNLQNVECLNIALGESNGDIDVPVANMTVAGNFGGVELGRDNSKHKCKKVKKLRLDDCNISKCDFIKIDVEGMEYDVLMGAQNTIQRLRPTLFIEDDRNDLRIRELLFKWDYISDCKVTWLYNPNNYLNNEINHLTINDKPAVSRNLLCKHKSLYKHYKR